jgi:hypothetical protein
MHFLRNRNFTSNFLLHFLPYDQQASQKAQNTLEKWASSPLVQNPLGARAASPHCYFKDPWRPLIPLVFHPNI